MRDASVMTCVHFPVIFDIEYSQSNSTEYIVRSYSAHNVPCRQRRIIVGCMTVLLTDNIYEIVYHSLLQVAQNLVNRCGPLLSLARPHRNSTCCKLTNYDFMNSYCRFTFTVIIWHVWVSWTFNWTFCSLCEHKHEMFGKLVYITSIEHVLLKILYKTGTKNIDLIVSTETLAIYWKPNGCINWNTMDKTK